MTLAAFEQAIHQMQKKDPDIHVSPDFQCDQTGGFPTSLCVSWTLEKAWLDLNEHLSYDGDISVYQRMCADYGIRQCADVDQFNSILEDLGEDAYQSASLPIEDEDPVMTM